MREDNEVRVYNRVRMLREDRGISRSEFADAVGIAYRTAGYIERADYNVSLRLGWRISGFFGLPLDSVFSPTPFKPLSEELFEASGGVGGPRREAVAGTGGSGPSRQGDVRGEAAR